MGLRQLTDAKFIRIEALAERERAKGNARPKSEVVVRKVKPRGRKR